MTTAEVNLNGLKIQFPYVPYECQSNFMEKVVEALTNSSNAALESPTGTGKTLSLLCATLAWLQIEKEKITPKQQLHSASGMIDPMVNNNGQNVQSGGTNFQLYPKVFYASRTHSQLQQIVRELNKTVYKSQIKVVTLAGRDQLCVNERVLKEQNSEARGHLCRGLTRAGKCAFKNQLEKDDEFIDEMYKDACGGRVMDIEDLITTAKRMKHCPFYRSRQMFSGADLILLPYTYLLDPKTRESYEIKLRGNILIFDEAHNLEQVAEESISIDFSTKTLSAAISETKKVMELLLDEEERLRQEGDTSEITFDQLAASKGLRSRQQQKEDREKERRPKIPDVANLLIFLQEFEEKIDALDAVNDGAQIANLQGRVFPGQKMPELLESAGIFRAHRDAICSLVDQIGVWLAKNAGVAGSGVWAVRSTNLSEFSSMIARVFVDTFESCSRGPSGFVEQHVAARGIPVRTGEPAANFASQNFQLFVEKQGGSKDAAEKGPLLIDDSDTDENDDGGACCSKKPMVTLHYWCFSAGVAMRFLQSRGVRSILVASGTLAPMSNFLASMGIPFPGVLESGHVARPTQLMVATLRHGPGNVDLCGTYQRRNDAGYKQAVGEVVAQTVETTPQGILVFFASYSQMNTFVGHWKTPVKAAAANSLTIWSRMERRKRVFIEPKSRLEIPGLFQAFDEAIRTDQQDHSGGAVLLAVCRGKLSEGIDFADSHCRTVVIVGIPFPPLFDPRIVLKRAWLGERRRVSTTKSNKNGIESGLLSPEEWYRIEGFRAVNQALGRIIRHRDDFGAVLLADSRFASAPSHTLPSWIRGVVSRYNQPEQLFPVMQRFFAEHGLLVERSRQRMATEATSCYSNTKLSNADGSNVQRRRKATSTFCGEEVSTPPANSLNHHFLKRQRAQQQLVSDIDDIYGSAFGITSSVKNSKKKSGGASSAESSQQQQDLELCDIFEKKPGTQQQQAVVSAIGGISSGGGGTKRRHTIKLLTNVQLGAPSRAADTTMNNGAENNSQKPSLTITKL